MIHIATGPQPPTRGAVYLPFVATSDISPQAQAFFDLMRADSRQQRPQMQWCPSLLRATRWRVEDMARLNYFAHCSPRGDCPNRVAIAAGCRLPVDYPPNGNSIESLVAGTGDPVAAFNALANSPRHAAHLFGLNDFFAQQQDVGICMIEDVQADYIFYWSVLIAPCSA